MHYELSHFYSLVARVIPYSFCTFLYALFANFVADD